MARGIREPLRRLVATDSTLSMAARYGRDPVFTRRTPRSAMSCRDRPASTWMVTGTGSRRVSARISAGSWMARTKTPSAPASTQAEARAKTDPIAVLWFVGCVPIRAFTKTSGRAFLMAVILAT